MCIYQYKIIDPINRCETLNTNRTHFLNVLVKKCLFIKKIYKSIKIHTSAINIDSDGYSFELHVLVARKSRDQIIRFFKYSPYAELLPFSRFFRFNRSRTLGGQSSAVIAHDAVIKNRKHK